ncbi:hypothetical protein [Cylindrospermum stagnale]|uniref:hypothetical protein n=1 Tax=Cylindrospermum stagnale TaxID=142864 RepID=UPI0002F42D77|nr:hypothetical protein [Cylindrospermum stagnale]
MAYYSIAQADMADIFIPIISLPQQEKIVHNVNSSFELKFKSKQLLEIAKTGVEKAIETDETIATDWMNQQLADLDLGINSLDE